jgi:uncharacterized protein YdhG (YjbR/CyaY superfamily)
MAQPSICFKHGKPSRGRKVLPILAQKQIANAKRLGFSLRIPFTQEFCTMPTTSHDEYFATHPVAVRKLLEQVQEEVERQIPGALRCISYGLPAFKQERTFFYFAAFKKHIGVYPPVTENQALMTETARYRGPKGNLSFTYDEAIPLTLIGRVAVALASQYAAK